MTTQERITTAMSAALPLGSAGTAINEEILRGILKQTYEMRNNRLSKSDEDTLVQYILPRLSNGYRHLTMQEVRLVCEFGVTGEYKDAGTVPTAANILAWLNIYARSAERYEAQKRRDAERGFNGYARREGITPDEHRRRNAENSRTQPGIAFERYKREGRAAFTFPQYIEYSVWAPLNNAGKFRAMTQATLDRLTRRAEQEMKAACGNDLFTRLQGVNGATFRSYLCAEIVYAYFDALIASGKSL